MKSSHLVALIALAIAPSTLFAQSAAEKEVLTVIDRLFVAMTARDTAASRALILPGGYFYSTRDGKTRVQSDTAYISSLTRGTDKWLERIYEPKVLIHKEVATVWARYDFFVNDKRTHCGVDSFTFLRTETGWRMANVSYNVEPTGCP